MDVIKYYKYFQIATDPKLALQKAKELWATLSLPEPENQARPATLEQLLVLLTRESARRLVHIVNGTAVLASRAPYRLGRTLLRISHQMLHVADVTLKVCMNFKTSYILPLVFFIKLVFLAISNDDENSDFAIFKDPF